MRSAHIYTLGLCRTGNGRNALALHRSAPTAWVPLHDGYVQVKEHPPRTQLNEGKTALPEHVYTFEQRENIGKLPYVLAPPCCGRKVQASICSHIISCEQAWQHSHMGHTGETGPWCAWDQGGEAIWASASAWPTVTSSHCNRLYALPLASCVMSLRAYMSISTPLCTAPHTITTLGPALVKSLLDRAASLTTQ